MWILGSLIRQKLHLFSFADVDHFGTDPVCHGSSFRDVAVVLGCWEWQVRMPILLLLFQYWKQQDPDVKLREQKDEVILFASVCKHGARMITVWLLRLCRMVWHFLY